MAKEVYVTALRDLFHQRANPRAALPPHNPGPCAGEEQKYSLDDMEKADVGFNREHSKASSESQRSRSRSGSGTGSSELEDTGKKPEEEALKVGVKPSVTASEGVLGALHLWQSPRNPKRRWLQRNGPTQRVGCSEAESSDEERASTRQHQPVRHQPLRKSQSQKCATVSARPLTP